MARPLLSSQDDARSLSDLTEIGYKPVCFFPFLLFFWSVVSGQMAGPLKSLCFDSSSPTGSWVEILFVVRHMERVDHD